MTGFRRATSPVRTRSSCPSTSSFTGSSPVFPPRFGFPLTLPFSHSATGRTLPHCYLETVSISRAQHLIDTMDRSQLGDRTVRVKWERPGELMRDVRPASSTLPLSATTGGKD